MKDTVHSQARCRKGEEKDRPAIRIFPFVLNEWKDRWMDGWVNN